MSLLHFSYHNYSKNNYLNAIPFPIAEIVIHLLFLYLCCCYSRNCRTLWIHTANSMISVVNFIGNTRLWFFVIFKLCQVQFFLPLPFKIHFICVIKLLTCSNRIRTWQIFGSDWFIQPGYWNISWRWLIKRITCRTNIHKELFMKYL